jgi:hypothetical protein
MVVALLLASTGGGPSLALPDGDERRSILQGSIRHSNTTAALNPHNNLPPLAIFYHIYVPPERDEARKARDIIQQQLHDLGRALSTTPNLPISTLYYTSVGQEVEEAYVNAICQQYPAHIRSCNRLKHLAAGFEEHTLQELFEYCQEHEDHRVIYVHTKGSYHSSPGQNRWRRHMTDAVASPDCIARAHIEDCDLCGLLFIARPTHHFTGNMFNARCSYIRRLIPPLEFEARMNVVYNGARSLVDNGTLTAILFDLNVPWNMGTQRYAMEHWHGSHPSSEIICDVATNPDRRFWKSLRAEDRKPDDWQFQRFPRRPLPGLPTVLEENDSIRKREYFLLPGLIFKWYLLYKEVPSPSSWVWSSYQDGAFWRDQVDKHGSKAVEIVANGLRPTEITY